MSNPSQRQLIWNRRKALLDMKSELEDARSAKEYEDIILINGIVCRNRVFPPPPAGETPAKHFVCEYKTIMETLKLTAPQAMDALKIPEDKRSEYLSQLKL